MEKAEVLSVWMEVHGRLSVDQQRAFLERSELDGLRDVATGAVVAAIAREPKLIDIVGTVRRTKWWFDGQPCQEDGLEWCSRCKPHAFPSPVYVTTGSGAAFHRSRDCEWLQEGQRRVHEPAPVEAVPAQTAMGRGKFPCLNCFPR